MKAMVLAAGLGTRLRPLTHEIPKPLVPVANRPIMEHILELLANHGLTEVVANLHWFGDTIRGRFGGRLRARGRAHLQRGGGAARDRRRGAKRADFFGDEPFVVMAADALTDIDLGALMRTHEANDWIATLAVKRVNDTTEYGVVVTADGRPDRGLPGEARPRRRALGPRQLHDLRARARDLRPLSRRSRRSTSRSMSSRRCSRPTCRSASTSIDDYWNDVGSLPEYLQGNLDVLTGAIGVEPAGELLEARCSG